MRTSNLSLLVAFLTMLTTATGSIGQGNSIPFLDYSDIFSASMPEENPDLHSAPNHVCIKREDDDEHFDYSSLDDHDKLQRFVEGPCSPVILVPGVLATKMEVEIDCKKLKKKHPETFEACGWNTCDSPSWYEVWLRKPKDSYNLWIPDIFSPMSVIANELHSECFKHFFSLNYDPTKRDFMDRYSMPDGLNLTYFNQNSKHPHGGLDAIGDLDPKPKQPYVSGELLYFETLRRKLNKMGYQDGLTLFGSPYDWRRSPIANHARFTIKRTLQFLKKTTGKKTITIAHSMGNMQMLFNANQLSQQDKDNLIRHYVAVMPPFSGSTKAAASLMGASNVDPYGLGISMETLKVVDAVSSSLYDLYPKPSYDLLKDEEFFGDLMKRLEAEGEHREDADFWAKNKDKLPYSWIPAPDEVCSSGNMSEREWKNCGLHIRNLADEALVTVQDRQYKGTYADREAFMSTQEGPFVSKTYWNDLMMEVKANDVEHLINPGIETTLIYTASLQTMYAIEYDYNAKEAIKKGQWADPDRQRYEMGDGTVNASAALLGPLRWAWEFEHGEKNAKGVKIVEYCSTYQTSWDFDYTKPSYDGLYCQCLDYDQNGHSCNHVYSLNDPYLVEYLANLVFSLDNPADDSNNAGEMTNADIKTILKTCPPLNDPINVYPSIHGTMRSATKKHSNKHP